MNKILDGKKLSSELRQQIKEKVDYIKRWNQDEITLAIIQVGKDPASSTYVKNKNKACNDVGIKCLDYTFPDAWTVDDHDIIKLIMQLNSDAHINGILVQLPLPKHLNEQLILQSIDPLKDVDCFHYANIGKLYTDHPTFLPCTPAGIIEILGNNNIEIAGKECVIIGRSNIVGKPMGAMMMYQNATVTIAHSKTENLKDICKRADILISAIGKPKFINNEYIKSGAVVIDVGINKNENGKLCGDVDFEDVYDKCSFITPVPGGVGPMTITMLLQNCVKCYCYQNGISY